MDKLVIHTGSYSLDSNNLTQAQIDAHVDKIVDVIPNCTHLGVGTYFDYATQIRMWASSIHAKGKGMFLRSAGFNSWQGRNGVPATGTPIQHRADIVTWLDTNSDVFEVGDVFEVIPDEPENGSYWVATYGPSGIGTNATSKAEFNNFIQLTLDDVQQKLIEKNVEGVATNYLFTNPSVAKDILNSQTASELVVGTDNYPENGQTTATGMATAMQTELNTWVVPAHSTRPKHITMGPSVWAQLTEDVQKDAYNLEFNVIKNTIALLDGVTIWQSGATWNPLSRIFEYTSGVWTKRKACGAINKFL